MLQEKRYKCVLFQVQRGIWKDMHAAPFWRVGDEAGPESTVCSIVFCVFCYFFIFLHEKKNIPDRWQFQLPLKKGTGQP